MTRMLSHRMSSETILNNAIRHQRLCNEMEGAEKFATAIQSPIDKLKEKHQISLDTAHNKIAAYDLVLLKDAILDELIHDISGRVKKYEYKSVWRNIYTFLFPDDKIATISYAILIQKPDVASELLLRLDSFKEENNLLEFKAPLAAAIADDKTAIIAYEQTNIDEKKALIEEIKAQDDVVKQYKLNFMDASELYGEKYSTRLFPKIPKSKEDELAEKLNEEPCIMTYRQLS